MSKKLAADYFARHKGSNECHITSDGRVFHTKGAAQGFAHGLKDKTISSFTRTELAPENIEVNEPVQETGSNTPKDEDPKDEDPKDEDPKDEDSKDEDSKDDVAILKASLEARLLGFDAATASYPDIVALCKELKLAADSNKKEDLIAALEAAKTNLEPQA